MAGDVEKDIKVLEQFIQVYCDTKHNKTEKSEKAGKGTIERSFKER